MIKIGIDIGGTFTDLVSFDDEDGSLKIFKTPSIPRHPEQAVINAIDGAGIESDQVLQIVLGTTIGVNTLLERKGSNVLFLTTKGFEDIPYIQRIDKQFNYNLEWERPKPFVKRRNCLGVEERIDSNGKIIVPLNINENFLENIRDKIDTEKIESIAICLLFSYINPVHEIELEKVLKQNFPHIFIISSHNASPVWKEYERSSTTIVDAYIRRAVSTFVSNLEISMSEKNIHAPLALMKSNGGRMLSKACLTQTLNTLFSGLAGGVAGASYFGNICGEKDIITLDMGGTSCDVCVIQDGMPKYTTEFEVEWGIPIISPVIDVKTIGAGGGSIAWVDKGGLLRVGPQSAGADPGPVCYSKGGTEPAFTDACITLGRLDPEYLLGGRMKVNKSIAEDTIKLLGQRLHLGTIDTAQAIVDIANENIANLIRLVTIEKGLDPSEFVLLAFGGAGPMVATEVAKALRIKRKIIPIHPGLVCAFGCLISIPRVDKVWTKYYRSDNLDIESIRKNIGNLHEEGLRDLREEGFEGEPLVLRSINMRYLGQNYELEIGISEDISEKSMVDALKKFGELHERLYGYSIAGDIVEFIQFNLTLIGTAPEISFIQKDKKMKAAPVKEREVYFKESGFVKVPICERYEMTPGYSINGPVIIEEMDSTTFVPIGQRVTVMSNGSMLLEDL